MRLCAKKKEKKNSSQRRQAAKASGSYTERTIISLRLPTAGRSLRLCAKKNPPRRKAGKMQEPRGGPQFLCGSASLREEKRKKIARKVGKAQRIGNYFFAACPPGRIGRSADRQALRLCEN